ncbi:MAG: DUF2917 domain-containing protein [Chthoniobacteraceae bacterium]
MKDTLTLESTATLRRADVGAVAASSSPAALGEILPLQPGQIFRLEKSSRVSAIEVKAGIVWLTGTPAPEDVILSAGEKLVLGDHWPYVVQALGEAMVSLRKAPASRSEAKEKYRPFQRLPMTPFQPR